MADYLDLPPLFPELDDDSLDLLCQLSINETLAITLDAPVSPFSPKSPKMVTPPVSPFFLPPPAWPERDQYAPKEEAFLDSADPNTIFNVLDSPPLHKIRVRKFLPDVNAVVPEVPPAAPKKPKMNHKRKALLASAALDIRMLEEMKQEEENQQRCSKRQKFADEDERINTGRSKVVIAAKVGFVKVPNTSYEARQCMVNALATVLPLEGEISVLGVRCPVIVVGAIYISTQLNWIVLSRLNHRLYLNKHMVQDAEHLYESMLISGDEKRANVFKRSHKPHKNLKFYPSVEARLRDEPYPIMLRLPEHLRKFPINNSSALRKMQDFLAGYGQAEGFFKTFAKQYPSAADEKIMEAIYDPRLHGVVTEAVRGWSCFHKNRVDNRIQYVNAIDKLRASRLGKEVQPNLEADVLRMLPTILELNEKNHYITEHFKSFIAYVKSHPYQMFYPSTTFM